jgi:hypothetical protein
LAESYCHAAIAAANAANAEDGEHDRLRAFFQEYNAVDRDFLNDDDEGDETVGGQRGNPSRDHSHSHSHSRNSRRRKCIADSFHEGVVAFAVGRRHWTEELLVLREEELLLCRRPAASPAGRSFWKPFAAAATAAMGGGGPACLLRIPLSTVVRPPPPPYFIYMFIYIYMCIRL